MPPRSLLERQVHRHVMRLGMKAQAPDEHHERLALVDPEGIARLLARALAEDIGVAIDPQGDERDLRHRQPGGTQMRLEVLRRGLEDRAHAVAHGMRGANESVPRMQRRGQQRRETFHDGVGRRGVGDAADRIGAVAAVRCPPPGIGGDVGIGPVQQAGVMQPARPHQRDPIDDGVRTAVALDGAFERFGLGSGLRVTVQARRRSRGDGAKEAGSGGLPAHDALLVERIGLRHP